MYSLSLFNFIGIIFGALGILIGVWGVYLARKRKRRIKYSLVIINTIVLFDTIVKNIPGLSVLYKGSEISPGLVLIECALINTGTSAVLTDMIEQPVSLILSEDHKWVEVDKVSTSNGMQGELSLPTPQKMIINSGLFKVDDFIRFKALLLVPREHINNLLMVNLEKIMSITHRIADMKNIIIVNLKELNIDRLIKLDIKKLKTKFYKGILLGVMSIFGFIIIKLISIFNLAGMDDHIIIAVLSGVLFLTCVHLVSILWKYFNYRKVKKYAEFI